MYPVGVNENYATAKVSFLLFAFLHHTTLALVYVCALCIRACCFSFFALYLLLCGHLRFVNISNGTQRTDTIDLLRVFV